MIICKWKNNADSPVMFMIDDLANVWVDLTDNNKIEIGEDWGFAGRYSNSSVKFLEDEILKSYPLVKVNFYVPVGERVGMILSSKIKMHSYSINHTQDSINFFSSIHNNSRYELAYHGLTHGKAFESPDDNLQEWECYDSLSDAISTISIGKEIFKSTVGEYPLGGKYCGYKSGLYGDESIIKSDFMWWHRYWNKGIETNEKDAEIGTTNDRLISYDLSFINESFTVDIPSTLGGDLFNNNSNNTIKLIAKKILWPLIKRKREKEIDYLIDNKLVISIQEHISPARNDGKIQTPNIFTDKKSLKLIFKYLGKKNVWYCTGTELAKYFLLRTFCSLDYNNDNKFKICSKNVPFEITKNDKLTILFSKEYKYIIQPDKTKVFLENYIANIKIQDGEYLLF